MCDIVSIALDLAVQGNEDGNESQSILTDLPPKLMFETSNSTRFLQMTEENQARNTPRHRKYLLREAARAHIKETFNIDIPKASFNKICAPSQQKGPPVAGWMGSIPLYLPEDIERWVEETLISPVRKAKYNRGPGRPPKRKVGSMNPNPGESSRGPPT